MTEVFIRFPVHCPICKQEWTSSRTKSEILDALDNNKPIRAYAECHDWHIYVLTKIDDVGRVSPIPADECRKGPFERQHLPTKTFLECLIVKQE